MLLSVLPAAPAWLATYQHHELLLGRGLGILGAWALLNLVVSGYQLPRTDRREWPHHFHFMNCAWAFVNAVLAAVGILRTHPGRPPLGFSLADARADVQLTSQIFLFNAGLDIGYVLVALWLLNRATYPSAQRPERLDGYGRSVQLQGAFLLVFDVAMWWLLGR
ncbi:hypothetical protein GKZ68_16140 [Hymenobacter sp. BRD128]|uniref:DUF6992 family protein n=1 Tax=Hymenobacter sp. BRD128 TaxID=2675878 RepID=UPI001566AC80|nr:hypothetical protein [Hymenobacter sp. BRD128]QKG58013.1 hypothetical protein GKZ68_16140 [Hymenobacter sp. BRD128]